MRIRKAVCSLLLSAVMVFSICAPVGRAAECEHDFIYIYTSETLHTCVCRKCGTKIDEPHLCNYDMTTGRYGDCVCGYSEYHICIVADMPAGTGTVYVSSSSNPGVVYESDSSRLYAEGETLTFLAFPNRGYRFLGWYTTVTSETTHEGAYETGELISESRQITKTVSWLSQNCVGGSWDRGIHYINVVCKAEAYKLEDVSRLFQWWNGRLEMTEAERNSLNANGDPVTDLRDAAEIFRIVSETSGG